MQVFSRIQLSQKKASHHQLGITLVSVYPNDIKLARKRGISKLRVRRNVSYRICGQV